MPAALRVLAFLFGAIAVWLVFGALGEITAGILSPEPVLALAISGIAASFASSAAVTYLHRRRGASPGWLRYCAAGFSAFFCFQLFVAGLPDWDPIWLTAGALLCGGAALLQLLATRGPVLARQ